MINEILGDVFFFIGLTMVGYGLYLIHLSLALVVCGGILIFLGYKGASK